MATLAEVRLDIQRQADIENDDHVGSTELNRMINRAYREGWAIVINAFEDYKVTTSGSFTLTSSVNTQAVASDFLKLRRVERQYGSRWLRVDRARDRDEPDGLGYVIEGSALEIVPAEAAAGTYRYKYLPTPAALANDADVVEDPIGLLEQYVIDVVVTRCKAKSEEDSSLILALRQDLEKTVRHMAQNRDAGQARQVRDARAGQRFRFQSRSRTGWPV